MKKIYFIAMVLLAALLGGNVETFSQGVKQSEDILLSEDLLLSQNNEKSSGFSVLKKGDSVAFSINLSEALLFCDYPPVTEKEYSKKEGKYWEDAKESFHKTFLRALEKSIGKGGLCFIDRNDKKAKFRIILRISTIDTPGNDYAAKGTIFLIDKKDWYRPIASIDMTGWATESAEKLYDRLGLSFKSLGTQFGEFLKDKLSAAPSKSIEEYKTQYNGLWKAESDAIIKEYKQQDKRRETKRIIVIVVICIVLAPIIIYLLYWYIKYGIKLTALKYEIARNEEEKRRKFEQSVIDYYQNPKPKSVADELAKLADLRDRGVITNEEFEAQKNKLLK